MIELKCPQVQTDRWRPFWWPSWLSDKANTFSGKRKKLIFHEDLYKLQPKNNTSIKYKDDLHVHQHHGTLSHQHTHRHIFFLHKYYIYIVPLDRSA